MTVDKGDFHVGAVIVFKHRRFPGCVPVENLILALGMVLDGVKRRDVPGRFSIAIFFHPDHGIDGNDFIGSLSATVSQYGVSGFLVADPDWVGRVLEQVDRRRATEFEVRLAKCLEQSAVPFRIRELAQENVNAELFARVA